jgi:hypothetical protein
MAEKMDPIDPNERELTPEDLRVPAKQQIRRALAKASRNPPAALAGLHAAEESMIAQELGRLLQQFLAGDLHIADLADVLRLGSARIANVKLMNQLLGQEQRLDAAAGPNPDQGVRR